MDFRIEQLINSAAGGHPFWDAVMIGVAAMSEYVFVAFIFLWFLYGWIRGLRFDRQGAITALIAAGGALLVNQVISHIWDRPRPFVTHPQQVHVLLSHSTDASFPSDHVSAGFAIAMVLFMFHRRAGLVALLCAAVMGYARVYVGDHYPGDVAAGFAVGVLVGLVLTTKLSVVMDHLRRLGDRAITLLHLPLPDRAVAGEDTVRSG